MLLSQSGHVKLGHILKLSVLFFQYSYQAPRIQDLSRRVQSVAEQQAKVKAIREVHEREQRMLLREQQELQQQALAQERQQQHVVRSEKSIIAGGVVKQGQRERGCGDSPMNSDCS